MTIPTESQLQAVLFDLDGTLLDTAPEFTHCLNALLKEEGKPTLTVETVRYVVSEGTSAMLNLAFNITPEHPEYNKLKDKFLTHYASILGAQSQMFYGIEELLEQLDTFEVPWGIVTNKPECFALPLIKQIQCFNNAKVVISGDTLEFSKPHPAPLQVASQQMNVAPHQVVYIGDAPKDVIAATAAGMPSIVAAYGYVPPNTDPAEWKANLVVNQVSEIFPWLKINLKGFN